MRACVHTHAAYTEPMLTESAELNIPNKVYCDSSCGLLASQHKRVVAPDTHSRPPKPTTKQVHKGCTPNPALSMACQPWWRAQASSACVSGRTPESTVPPGTNDHNLSMRWGQLQLPGCVLSHQHKQRPARATHGAAHPWLHTSGFGVQPRTLAPAPTHV